MKPGMSGLIEKQRINGTLYDIQYKAEAGFKLELAERISKRAVERRADVGTSYETAATVAEFKELRTRLTSDGLIDEQLFFHSISSSPVL